MKIQINKVEGKTSKAGSKQGRVYTLINESTVKGFFDAVSDKGKKMTLWNVKKDWSVIGLCNEGGRRYSYTKDFKIINE